MKTAKFWLVQIVMVTALSLVLGSAAFAAPPDHAKGAKGEEMKMDNANDNASFKRGNTSGGEDEGPTCPEGTMDVNGDGSVCL